MMLEYHSHTHISFDADPQASACVQCAAAVERGIREIAFTDHYEMDLALLGTLPPPDLRQAEQELSEARERYAGRLTVLRGIELGQPCYDPAFTRQLLQERAYDIVLGSLHNLPGGLDFYYIDCTQYTDAELKKLWETYLEELAAVASNPDTDVLTHICYPLRYFPPERRAAVTGLPEKAREQYEPILRGLISQDKALEINTSCMRTAGFPAPDPGLALLRFYRELGGRWITVGSDAHKPADIGAGLRDACLLAQAAGFAHLAGFRQREKHPVKISEVLQ